MKTPCSSQVTSLQENKGQVQALLSGSFLKVCQSSPSEANPGVLRDFIPTLFCQRAKHLIYLSTIPLSFNSLFPSFSRIHSNISTLISLIYSSYHLQFSSCTWILLASQLPEHILTGIIAKVLSPRFSSLVSLWKSSSQLSSLQELAPLLITLCKEIHISLVPLHCTSTTDWGLGYCRNKSVACNFLERTSTIFSQFPHTQTLLCIGQYANLSPHFLISYTLPSKALKSFHKPSIFSALGAWDTCKKTTAPGKLPRNESQTTSFVYITHLKKAFRPLLSSAAFNKGAEV